MSANRVSTAELRRMRDDQTARLSQLVPTGHEHRWVTQEIELLDEELDRRAYEGGRDA
jgi:hypothetical protein